MHAYANPNRFMRLAPKLLTWAIGLGFGLFAGGLYLALFASPPDYQQGETVRIMYVHVPAAWMSLFVYVNMAVAGACYLVWKHPLADIAAGASAGIGAVFTLVTLVTGSLWGKPTWGTWWVWDARLTSVLVLFFLYIGYIALRDAIRDPERRAKACALLSLAGAVNIPIIKFSVEWWNTLHQPASIIRAGGPAIDPSMQAPLYVMAGAFLCLYVALLVVRMQAMLLEGKVRRLHMRLGGQA